jgi:hypothetical protein
VAFVVVVEIVVIEEELVVVRGGCIFNVCNFLMIRSFTLSI